MKELPGQDRSGAQRASLVPTVAPVGMCLIGAAAASCLWTAGLFTTPSPRQNALLLTVGVLFGLGTISASLLRGVKRWVRGWLRIGGVLVLGASVSFPIALYLVTPGDAERWTATRPEEGEEGAPRRLRVVQFNVLHDYPRFRSADRRLSDLENALRELDADILVLQEVWSAPGYQNVAEVVGSRLGLHVVYARANGSRRLLGFEEGVAVLSRYPLGIPEILELAPRKHLFDRRIALSVDVALPGAEPLKVVSTHLTNEAPDITEAQALDLLERVEGTSADRSTVLLAGDLNAGAASAALRHFSEAGWSGVKQGDRDHMLLRGDSARWRALWSEWVLSGEEPFRGSQQEIALSDHAAILAELEAAGPPASSRWLGSWDQAARAASEVDRPIIERTVLEIGEMEGVESVLVVHDGALIAERYFRGATPERLQNMKSASKGVLSALIGIAIAQGHLALEDPIAQYLSETVALEDSRKERITVRDLLTMTSGLESTSFAAYGAWASSRNLVRNALERPSLAEPGTRFAYSTGNTHLLSAVLTAATGQSALAFAREHLFEPLGVREVVWERDRQGIYLGGNNLAMRSRDMARFGLLYLDRGRWGEQQIVPWSWVDESTVARYSWSRRRGGGYGYLWWIRGTEERGAYNASGFGGQHIYVSRADDLVVVVNSTEVSKGRTWRGDLYTRIQQGIVQVVRTQPKRSD